MKKNMEIRERDCCLRRTQEIQKLKVMLWENSLGNGEGMQVK